MSSDADARFGKLEAELKDSKHKLDGKIDQMNEKNAQIKELKASGQKQDQEIADLKKKLVSASDNKKKDADIEDAKNESKSLRT